MRFFGGKHSWLWIIYPFLLVNITVFSSSSASCEKCNLEPCFYKAGLSRRFCILIQESLQVNIKSCDEVVFLSCKNTGKPFFETSFRLFWLSPPLLPPHPPRPQLQPLPVLSQLNLAMNQSYKLRESSNIVQQLLNL